MTMGSSNRGVARWGRWLGLNWLGGFMGRAWELGKDDPRKVIHCVKVGLALSVVSLFYYLRPLNDGVGGNAMWAIMTVVVIFEYTVGATLCKCLNRAIGTFLAGFLAVGVHFIANHLGNQLGPIFVGVSVFLLASAATFSRFIPVIKARFDYGAMIFILTFSLISISGYRVGKLLEMAHQRLSTIVIGTSMCIFISMLICPVWAGEELHLLVVSNMEKLANSLDGCVAEFFNNTTTTSGNNNNKQSTQFYKCVLNSIATEDSLAGFARWEPAHGRFNFKHPWKKYLKIGSSARSYAYCIEAINGCLLAENQAPDFLKKHLADMCLKVSSSSSNVIRELAMSMKTMRKSSSVDILIGEMETAVQELQQGLKFLPDSLIPNVGIPLVEVVPVAAFASLLMETTTRIEDINDAFQDLAASAQFKEPEPKDKDKDKDNVNDDDNNNNNIVGSSSSSNKNKNKNKKVEKKQMNEETVKAHDMV